MKPATWERVRELSTELLEVLALKGSEESDEKLFELCKELKETLDRLMPKGAE